MKVRLRDGQINLGLQVWKKRRYVSSGGIIYLKFFQVEIVSNFPGWTSPTFPGIYKTVGARMSFVSVKDFAELRRDGEKIKHEDSGAEGDRVSQVPADSEGARCLSLQGTWHSHRAVEVLRVRSGGGE